MVSLPRRLLAGFRQLHHRSICAGCGDDTRPLLRIGDDGADCCTSRASRLLFRGQSSLQVYHRMQTAGDTPCAGNSRASFKALGKNCRRTSPSASEIKAGSELRRSFQATFGASKFFDARSFENVLRLRTFADRLTTQDTQLGRFFTVAVLRSLFQVPFSFDAATCAFETKKN